MADEKLAELLETQQSLTEWFNDIKHLNTESLRVEDNEKRERLLVLNKIIDLPFDRPTQFKGNQLRDDNKLFTKYLAGHGQELCALRLIPLNAKLPKLRMRGKTVTDAYDWFKEQRLDPNQYRADFIPHTEDSLWSTIFVVNKFGIQGEIIYGGHSQLTQGFYDDNKPMTFRYDFKNWVISENNDNALSYLQEIVKYIHVNDRKIRDKIAVKLGSTYSNNYIDGYFETTQSSLGTWYIDYSPSLGKMYSDLELELLPAKNRLSNVTGRTASSGKAEGRVKIVNQTNFSEPYKAGTILVCEMTTPQYLPIMLKSAAIVTDKGGVLCHAAIVARELKIPCIVGAGNATAFLKNGDKVRVDADSGSVLKL